MAFWLVQRFTHEKDATGALELRPDRMGASEFEGDVLPKALDAMHKERLRFRPIEVITFGIPTTLYVVLPRGKSASIQGELQAWFDKDLPSKENPLLKPIITRIGRNDRVISDEELATLPVGWLALHELVFFSLNEDTAIKWFTDIWDANRERERKKPGFFSRIFSWIFS